MLNSRTHLAVGLAALLSSAASVPGSPGAAVPATVRLLLEMASSVNFPFPGLKAVRPEPIEVEPVGAAVIVGVRDSGK